MFSQFDDSSRDKLQIHTNQVLLKTENKEI
jgi:hypothetical protein